MITQTGTRGRVPSRGHSTSCSAYKPPPPPSPPQTARSIFHISSMATVGTARTAATGTPATAGCCGGLSHCARRSAATLRACLGAIAAREETPAACRIATSEASQPAHRIDAPALVPVVFSVHWRPAAAGHTVSKRMAHTPLPCLLRCRQNCRRSELQHNGWYFAAPSACCRRAGVWGEDIGIWSATLPPDSAVCSKQQAGAKAGGDAGPAAHAACPAPDAP
jgi:hypothetical protein